MFDFFKKKEGIEDNRPTLTEVVLEILLNQRLILRLVNDKNLVERNELQQRLEELDKLLMRIE